MSGTRTNGSDLPRGTVRLSDTSGDQRSLGAMVSGVTEDVSLLVRDEIALAKTELKQAARAAALSSAMLAVAAVLALFGLLFLLVTIAYAIVAAGLPVWAGFGIVTLALLIVGGILALLGLRRLRTVHGPERAIRQLNETKAVLSGERAS